MSERTLKQLVGALTVIAVLWGVAWVMSRGGGGSVDAPNGLDATFEGVDENTVTAVRLVSPGLTVELRKEDGSWKANGFQADSGSVARFFEAVSETSIGDLMATNPANHQRMGVAGDSARTLEIDVGGSTRTIVLGNDGPRFSTAYARLPGEDDVYLLEGNIRSQLTRDLDAWRNRRMVSIDTSAVTRISVERDGDAFTLVRGDSAWTLGDGAAAAESQVQNLLSELGGALVAAGFVHDGDPLADEPQGGRTVAYSEGGDVLADVTIGSGAGERWAMAAGDSVRYRIASFRANLIVPTLESVTPDD